MFIYSYMCALIPPGALIYSHNIIALIFLLSNNVLNKDKKK